MRYREVQEQLRTVGVLISKRGGSLRVNHFSGSPETAFFTSDLQEALRTGLSMARPKHLPKDWCTQRDMILRRACAYRRPCREVVIDVGIGAEPVAVAVSQLDFPRDEDGHAVRSWTS